MNDPVSQPASLPKFKPDFMKIVNEVKTVTIDPVGCWNSVRGTYGSVKDYYVNFLAPLALFAAIVSFINLCVIGTSVFIPNAGGIPIYESSRASFASGLFFAVVHFVFALVIIYLFAFILAKVAAKFSGTDDILSALKLVGYSRSPAIVASVLTLLPLGSLLALLVSIYCIYIYYQGISPMLAVPAEKRLMFFGVSLVVCAVAAIVVGALLAAVTGGAMLAGGI